jgi:hypothetical protein
MAASRCSPPPRRAAPHHSAGGAGRAAPPIQLCVQAPPTEAGLNTLVGVAALFCPPLPASALPGVRGPLTVEERGERRPEVA